LQQKYFKYICNLHCVLFTEWFICNLNMVLLTMIARIPDGLPLAASMQDDEQVFFLRTYFELEYNMN
jgi:hypothetical protein